MLAKLAALMTAISAGYAALAQYPGVRLSDEQEKIGTPASSPEPQKQVADDPRRIFQRLMSEAIEDRRTAAKQLAWHWPEFAQPDDARLVLTNLDSDEDQEVIFVLSGSPATTDALIFDHHKDGWREVGSFSYWWHWDPNQAEKLIELREIVDYGRKDILVRTRNGGTGIAETELAIFRMHEGKLYRVFRTVETADHTVCGHTADSCSFVRAERVIAFPESDNGSHIVVRHTRTSQPPKDNSKRPVAARRLISCTAFRWTPRRFTFVADKDTTARLCAAR